MPPKWDFALRGMRVDELRKVTIPPILRGSEYAPKKSLALALKSEVTVEGDLREGKVVVKLEHDTDKEDSLKWVSGDRESDLELTVRLLSINGVR